MPDNIYFLATGGGITLGGGEPLLHSHFIEEFCELCRSEWAIDIETSLNVPLHHLKRVHPFIAAYHIDVKDMNPTIYENYPQQHLLTNLQWLLNSLKFNTQKDVDCSREMLTDMGVTHFDEFDYTIRKKGDPHRPPVSKN